MAFYCELPNEQICDIGWERLFCTEQWLEDRIREIRGYSRERRVELGTNSFQNFARFSVEAYSGDHETLVATLGEFSAFALGISYLGRSSVTQAWKDDVTEMTCFAPGIVEKIACRFADEEDPIYRNAVTAMTIFGVDAAKPIGAECLNFCVCIACADTPNEAAFEWIRKIHREYLVLLERWDYALRAATISDDKSELGVIDDYLHEKPILPLREYRRQQCAEERKKRQADAERKKQANIERQERRQREAEEKEQRIKNAQAEYEAAIVRWKEQTEKAERDRKRALKHRLEQEEKRLRDTATQQRDAAVRKNDRAISNQEKIIRDAEQTLAGLGALKLAEKARQKKLIREAEEIIATAKAARKAAEDACTRELGEVEEKIKKAKERIQAEVEQAYPLPQKPNVPSELTASLCAVEAKKLYELLKRWYASGEGRYFQSEKVTLQDIMNEMGSQLESIDFSVFDPVDEPLTLKKLASVMKWLMDRRLVKQTVDRRRAYYEVVQ